VDVIPPWTDNGNPRCTRFKDMTSSGTQAIVGRPMSGRAVFSLVVALVAVATLTVPAASLGLGIVGLVMALMSRRRLVLEPRLRGSRLALAGAVLGGLAVVISAPGVIVGFLGFVARAIRLQLG